VIDWHGLGSNGPQQAMYSGYEDVAEAEGFIVVHPTGVADEAGGPNSWQLFPAPDRERDDLAFAGALIDELVANWCVDPTRVYSTGMSNGGFFTARLICEMSDRIAAAVSVAGTYHPDGCAPGREVPYIAIHGTDDDVVPYAGGESTLMTEDSPEELRVFFSQVIPNEFAEFAADAGCDAATDTDVGEDVIRHEYTGCDGDGPLIFFEVQGGGHTWPSSPMAAVTVALLGYTTTDIDATRDGWAFMSQFMVPMD
jgi:polyhydroxybutyrate depolymerase